MTFIDLAGHQKYLKTTVLGLTGYSPHHAMLVVSANSGIAGTTQEHLGLALALKVGQREGRVRDREHIERKLKGRRKDKSALIVSRSILW